MKHVYRLICAALVVFAVLAATPMARAQADEQCFPETGFCLSGRFLSYWQQNDGLAVFGYPTGPAQDAVNREDGRTYTTQQLERVRFERHPENAAPYDVLLGRLGDDALMSQGRAGRDTPANPTTDGSCLTFAETGRSVCDQAPGIGFRSYWLGHGLRDPQLNDFARSLALFGYPLTDATVEMSPTNGQPYLVQWFERARFEWHPDKPDQYKVLLGLLGNEAGGRTVQPIALSDRPFSQQTVIAVGTNLYWVEPALPDVGSIIKRYDAQTAQTSTVLTTTFPVQALAGDATSLVWFEEQANDALVRYDIATATTEVLLTFERAVYPFYQLAIAGDQIYYRADNQNTGRTGLRAYNWRTGAETLLSEDGLNPVAHDGMVLWSEFEDSGSGPSFTKAWSIVLQRGDERTVVSTSQDGLTYAFADNAVVWSYLAGNDLRAYAYNLETGVSTPLSNGEAYATTAMGRFAAWIERGTITAFRIVTRPVAGGPTTTRANLDTLLLKIAVLENGAVAYVSYVDSPPTNYELYIIP